MKIVTGGCSFTAHTKRDKIAWPYHLENKGYNIVHTAEMASGNGIILERIMSALDESVDLCIVMWSSPYRVEFLLNQEIGNYDSIIYRMRKTHALSNFYLTGKPHHLDPKSNWFRVGGGYETRQFGVPEVDEMLTAYFKWVHNLEYQFIQTCKSIVLLQSYCKSKGIRLINTCWMNIFDFITQIDNRKSGSNTFANKTTLNNVKKGKFIQYPIVNWYPNSLHWYEKIDWSNWVFYETNYYKRGGLAEFSIIENNDNVKESHPNITSQEKWASFLEKYINN